MGQTCSAACQHVEPDALELSRTDSPDPLMYDLMRKSIQATTSSSTENNASGGSSNHHKVGKRKPPGQHSLLFRNSKTESTTASGGGTSFDSSAATTNNNHTNTVNHEDPDAPLWLPVDTPVHCPTRLLIRRRSLRVMDEGSETHIYAIRYPEDTPDKIVSEQAAPSLESARQEQCPPKKTAVMNPPPATVTAGTSTGAADAPDGGVHVSKKQNKTAATPKAIAPPSLEGASIYSPLAMGSRPRRAGELMSVNRCAVKLE